MPDLSVVIIDDHKLFRDGLEALLTRRGIQVAASLGEGLRGVELAQKAQPDVVLLDVRMPDVDGIEILEMLKEQGFANSVVMLTTSEDCADLAGAMIRGAKGYLMKDIAPDDLVAALHSVVEGETVIAPSLREEYEKLDLSKPPPSRCGKLVGKLTPREREVLALLVEGQSNKMIAKVLKISDGTVKLHVNTILRKFGVHSRVEAAMIEVERNIHKGR